MLILLLVSLGDIGMKLLSNFFKLTVMKLTIFEKDYLGIKNNSYVIRLFHTLLQKVERDPHRQWTHKLLRNYVNATYELCTFIGKRSSEQLGDSSINICEDDDSDLNIFLQVYILLVHIMD